MINEIRFYRQEIFFLYKSLFYNKDFKHERIGKSRKNSMKKKK